MANEIDAGRIVASIVLDTQQARAEADTIEYIAEVLEQMGIKGAEATQLIKSCFADTAALKQYQNSIEILSAKIEAQRTKIEQLQSAKERYTKSGYYDKAGQSAEAIQKETIRLMELEAQFDKTYTAQDNYVKKTVTNYQKSADAAEAAAQKQANASAAAQQKQEKLDAALDKRQAGKNFAQGMNLATTSLRTFDSVAPDAVSSIGEIITQINAAKQAMLSGASAPLAWATAIVAAIGVVTNLIVSAAEKRRAAEQDAINAAADAAEANKEELTSLEDLSESYVTAATKLASGNATYSESIELKKQLSGIQDQLVEKYGIEADSIDVVNGNIRENIELLREQAVLKAQKYTAANYSDYADAEKKLSETKYYRIENAGDYGTDNDLRQDIVDFANDYVAIRNEEIKKEIEKGNKELREISLEGMEQNSQYMEFKLPQGQAETELEKYSNALKEHLAEQGIDVENTMKGTLYAIGESLHDATTDEIEKSRNIFEEYEKNQAIIDSNGEDLFKELEVDAYIAKISTLTSSLSELSSAYQTLSSGEALGADALAELVEKYPQLADYINETGDLSLANGEKIKEAYEAQRQAMISTLTEQKDEYEKQLDELQAKRQEALNDGVTDEAAAEYGELSAQYNEVSNSLSAVNAQLDIYNSSLGNIEQKDLTETINQQRASLENLASAYKSLSSGQQLNTDTVLSLTKAYPQLADYINATGDLTFASGEKIKQAYQAEYDAMIKNLETKKKQLEALGNESDELQEVNTQLAVYKACLSSIDEAPSFTDISGELKSLANAYRDLADSKQLDVDTMISMIDKYPEVASAIAAEGSLTKDQADIFKTLFEAKKNDYILTQQKAADNLKASLAETEGVIANISAQIEAYKKLDLIMGAIATAGLTIAMNMNKEQAGKIKKEIEKIEARVKAVQSIGADTYGKSDSKSGSKDTSNKALAEELKQLEHKKALGQLTSKQEYDWLVRINKKYKQNSDEKMDMEKRLYNAKKAWQDDIEASRKAKLQDAYKNIENLKSLGKMTAKEELAQLEKIRKTYKLNAEEIMELEIKIYNLKKEQKQDEVDSLNNLADAVTEALKNKYEEQRKIEEERINSSIESWQTWEDETVAAIQGQIDALDELSEADDREAKRQEYENKRQQLEMQLAYEKDDYNRKSIEKELAKLDNDEAKRIAELEREDLKKSLNQEIENVRKESEQQQQQLQEFLEANNKKYDDLTSDASLKAQTSKILMNSGQKEIVNLIKGYAPDYDLAGQTIGESLYNGFKSKVGDIEKYINGITSKVTSYQSKLAKTANTAADKFWATRSSYQKQISAAQAPAPVSVNQTVNFNQPVTTPVQTKRQLNTVSQALAQQIVNGY